MCHLVKEWKYHRVDFFLILDGAYFSGFFCRGYTPRQAFFHVVFFHGVFFWRGFPGFSSQAQQAHRFVFWIKPFSDVVNKTFVYKVTWYHEVFQIITHQPRVTNFKLFQQGYLKWTKSKRMYLSFGFIDWEKDLKTDIARNAFCLASIFMEYTHGIIINVFSNFRRGLQLNHD